MYTILIQRYISKCQYEILGEEAGYGVEKMRQKMEIIEESVVRHEGSWGVTEGEKMRLKITAEMNIETGYGSFEIYDIETLGNRAYAAGSLSLDDNKELIDYDGVYSLDHRIIEWLDSIDCISKDEDDYFRKVCNKVEGY